MLILKPIGKGNWAPLRVTVEGKRASPLLIRKGALLPLGGVVFRVCEVMA